MQTAYYSTSRGFPTSRQSPIDPLRPSILQLLSEASVLPCSAVAHSFTQLVPAGLQFQSALDVLYPLLDSPIDLSQRIIVSYLLYSLYAPHPITINPFRSVLFQTFSHEREIALKKSGVGVVTENEQLVWVLWKILRGEGREIGLFSPKDLARSPLPPGLKASNLELKVQNLELDDGIMEPKSSRVGTPSIGSTVQFPPLQKPGDDEETEKLSQGMNLLLAARNRVLTLSEQRVLNPLIPQLTSIPIVTAQDIPPLIAFNSMLGYPVLVALIAQPQRMTLFLDVLKRLPPTLPTFDVLGRLLREPKMVKDPVTGGQTTIADLVRSEVLGWFLHESIRWLERAEEEEQAGSVSDDRFTKGIQNLCRFFSSLVKFSIIDPMSDADTAEMKHFTLRYSRIEEANVLYRRLATSTF